MLDLRPMSPATSGESGAPNELCSPNELNLSCSLDAKELPDLRLTPPVTSDESGKAWSYTVTVEKSVEFENSAKNVGASLVKQVTEATNKAAGDGTTCATVLIQAILTEGCRDVAVGVIVMDLCNGINKAINVVTTHLKSKSWKIIYRDEMN